MYSKGADDRIKTCLSPDTDQEALKWHEEVTHEWSKKGLRTLYLAKRKLTKEEVEAWEKAIA